MLNIAKHGVLKLADEVCIQSISVNKDHTEYRNVKFNSILLS